MPNLLELKARENMGVYSIKSRDNEFEKGLSGVKVSNVFEKNVTWGSVMLGQDSYLILDQEHVA